MSSRIIEMALVLLISFSMFLNLSPVYGSEEGDADEIESLTGPFLWTHSGPVPIHYLKDLYDAEETETEFHIVQFEAPVGEPQVEMLESMGMVVLDYFPDYAYVVRTSIDMIDRIEDLPGVCGTSPFFSGLKVHPDLIREFNEGRNPFEGFNSITIETFTEEPILHELSMLGAGGSRTKETRYVVSQPVPPLDMLIEIDGIKWIEPRSEMTITNNVADGIIEVDQVWVDPGLDGSGQTIGISDTGIDTGVDNHAVYGDMHLDLDNRVTITDWSGSGPDDDNGHGTHVAGSVAGDGSRSNGNIRGMAYNSSVYFQALETDSGFLNTPSNLSLLFDQAYTNGARIHTNSWGSSSSALWGAYTAESSDVDWSMFTSPDLLILFAAGNDGKDGNSDGKVDQNSVSPPATSKSGLTVGASENVRSFGGFQNSWSSGWPLDFPVDPLASDMPSNNSQGLAAFSSRGPLDDGRLKPDVVAPGTNILSVRSSVGTSSGWGFFNNSYIYFGGTSMSTPITAGMAALVRQYYNQSHGLEAPLASLIKATIINGATDLSPGQYGASNPATREISRRPDVDQGWGRINMKDSVDPEDGYLTFLDNSSGISTGENLTRMFRVISPEKELRLTLAWSDYPGSLFAGKQLINDLDLVLQAPNGTIYRGNDLSFPYDNTRDSINPVEGISVEEPAVGWWKVTIEGTNIPRGPQHFSLVATGNITDMISNMLLLDRKDYSIYGDTVLVSLTSRYHSGDGTVSVRINSTTDTDGMNITLSEGSGLGIFTGSFLTSNSSTVIPNELHVSDGDLIFVEFDSPSGFHYRANASAWKPKRVDLVIRDENLLAYARYDDIRLRGKGDPGLDVDWTVIGSDLPWIGIFDDGIPSHGDKNSSDGIYNVVFYLSNEYDVDGNITLRVNDPHLGYMYYEQFSIRIVPGIPPTPRDLEATPLPTGNSVKLEWSRSSSVGVHHHAVYINRTDTLPIIDPSGWVLYSTTTGPENGTVVEGLDDGTTYHFRVSAVSSIGNMSSLSLWASAVPYDVKAPEIDYEGPPIVFTAKASLEFTADADLETIQLEYYEDSDGNGIADDNNTFLPAVNSTDTLVVWDTRKENGGPGDMYKIILRWRGWDEVPNLSDWSYMAGFGIDNTGPPFLELSTYPPRVTNGTRFNIIGDTEPLAIVTAVLNGENLGDLTAGMSGVFDLTIDLVEGTNHLNLTAFDLHGAGPRISNYTFTRDTSNPVALIRQTEEVMEIRCNCTSFISDSYDVGVDPDYTGIMNRTWILVDPFGATDFFYGERIDHVFRKTGEYSLTLRIRDHAMNRNETSISFEVVDNTPPVPAITGPLGGDEDTTYRYSVEGSSDNDPDLVSESRAEFLWIFEGPLGFRETSERYETNMLFPEPGYYTVLLFMTDEGDNNASVNATIHIMDITPPTFELSGDRVFDPGEEAYFNVSVEDNSPAGSPGPTYLWQLIYLDGGSGEPVSSSEEDSYRVTLVESGNYSLRIRVTDSSGNSRNDSLQLLVRKPVIIEEQGSEEKDPPPYEYIAFGSVIIGIILLIGIGMVVAGRRRYTDDVDMEWEDEDDLENLDEVEDDEVDWDDDDFEDWD